ncbi:MAG: cytochrome P450 [Deltaproteobacteria bacterium]|nr:cytochrome P450 [Deltaproteobacteria bacterium]
MSKVLSQSSPPLYEPRSGESWRNPFPMYRALRDEDPVHRFENERGEFWALSRFKDVFEAAVDAQTFSSAQGLTIAYGEMEELGLESPIVMMDPPDHTSLRKLAIKRFTPKQVKEVEPLVRDFVIQRVDRLCEMGEGDVVKELFKPLPSLVVGHFLGVPEADRPLFDRWTDAIVAANAEGEITSAGEALGELVMYFTRQIEEVRTQPGQDVISSLVHARPDGKEVSLARILGFAFTMVTGGNDTTTGLLSGAAELLAKNPQQHKLLVNDPALIPNAIEEFLRLSSPVQGLARMTTRDVEIEGTMIPKDKKVMLLYGSANVDEREFGENAAECDVTRKIRRHVALSYGPHHCIGAALVRMQSRIALEELMARCPKFKVDHAKGDFAEGNYTRRYLSLPFSATGKI